MQSPLQSITAGVERPPDEPAGSRARTGAFTAACYMMPCAGTAVQLEGDDTEPWSRSRADRPKSHANRQVRIFRCSSWIPIYHLQCPEFTWLWRFSG